MHVSNFLHETVTQAKTEEEGRLKNNRNERHRETPNQIPTPYITRRKLNQAWFSSIFSFPLLLYPLFLPLPNLPSGPPHLNICFGMYIIFITKSIALMKGRGRST